MRKRLVLCGMMAIAELARASEPFEVDASHTLRLAGLPPIALGPGASLVADPKGDRWIAISSKYEPVAIVHDKAGVRLVAVPITEAVSQITFAPEGNRFVAVVRPAGWTPDAAARAPDVRALGVASRSELVLVDWPRGGAMRVHPDALAPSTAPDWNPRFVDTHTLLFSSLRTHVAAFFTVDLDTAQVTQRTNLDLRRALSHPDERVPVASTDALEVTQSGGLLYSARRKPDEDELWLIEHAKGPIAANAKRLGEGRLVGRVRAGVYEIALRNGRSRFVDAGGRDLQP